MAAVPALLTIGATVAVNAYGAHKSAEAAKEAANIQTQASNKVQATNTANYDNAMKNINNLNMTYLPKLQAATWNPETRSAWGQAGVTPYQPLSGTQTQQGFAPTQNPGVGPVGMDKMNLADSQDGGMSYSNPAGAQTSSTSTPQWTRVVNTKSGEMKWVPADQIQSGWMVVGTPQFMSGGR